ncbi:MAG: hypothetical protein LC769_05155 [Chloroflexi bacterium]|nr:hypothetical protein [Chloroflexota bacterium]
MTQDIPLARKMYQTLEPYHAMVYFVPEAPQAYARAGLEDRTRGYFASRAAPLGPVSAEVVIAAFYNFSPALVRSVIPAAWQRATPEALIAARLDAVDLALRRMLGNDPDSDGHGIGSPAVAEAAELAREASAACTPQGRALYAGHAALPWPDARRLALWHAITLLREYRGDGHIAALLAEGFSGIEALITYTAAGNAPASSLRKQRGWSEDEWAAGEARLRERGWLDADGALTAEGRARRDAVEERTDELARAPWDHLGADRCARLREIVRPLSKAIVDAGTFPASMQPKRTDA